MSNAESLHIVGIGTSAGGLETLQELFKTLPSDTGLAFVLVQHLSPTHKSLMHELLGKHISMPITVVEEKTQLLPNHIYLISKDWDLELRRGQLHPVEKEPGAALKTPIDRFFHSAAQGFENRTIAIVLSGTGTDGSGGIKAVKEKGGIVIVQNPDTAKFDGMPQAAISTGTADFVLDVAAIGKRLELLGRQIREGEKLGDKREEENELLDKILTHIKAVTKTDFTYYRKPTLLRRIDKRCKIANTGSLSKYYQLLLQDENETHTLAQEFLIGVSSFFRDEAVWKSLEKKAVPELFERKPAGETIRAWVGGCSTGEEAYSLAILMEEYKRQTQHPLEFKIFASDLDKAAISIASKGFYGPDIIQQVPSYLLDRYFERNGKGYSVRKELRERIVFAQHNLITDPPFIKMDLVSCRNTLIYLTTTTQRKLFTKFHFALNFHGFLVLGTSENLGEMAGLFKPLEAGTNIFRNIEEKKNREFIREHSATTSTLSDRKRTAMHQEPAVGNKQDTTDTYAATLLQEHAPTSIFINHQFDILYLHGDTDAYLRLPQRSGSLNLLKMLDLPEQVLMRNGVQQALQQRNALFENVSFNKGKHTFTVDIRFKEIWNNALKEKSILIELYQKEQASATAGTAPVVMNADQLLFLESEVKEKDQQLLTLKEQLETSNEQLQASNEELHASNQELQSSNEELQSVNEELHTLNTELKQKIDEVIASNTDIDNLFTSTNIATLFLDQELKIRKHTPQLRDLIFIAEQDTGRSITDFNTRFSNYTLEEDAREVLKSQKVLEREVVTRDGKYFLCRTSPYRQLDGAVCGVVMLFIDLTEKHKAALELKETADRLSLVLETSQTGYAELLTATNQVYYDERYANIFGVSKNDNLPLEKLLERVHPDDRQALEVQLQHALTTSGSIAADYRIIVPETGQVRYINSYAHAIKNEKGEVSKIVGALQDVTLRKQQEEEALWYWRLLDESHNEIFIFDASSLRFIMVNKGARENLNYSLDELRLITPTAITPDFSRNDFEELLNPLRSGKEEILRFNTIFQRKNGSQYPVLINLQLNTFKNKEVFTALVQDISELVKTQQELQKANERLDFAIRGTSDGIWDWPNIHGQYFYWSPRMYELFGLKAEEVGATLNNFLQQFHPDDRDRSKLAIQAHLNHAVPYDLEVRMQHKTAGYRWFRIRGQAFRNKVGKNYRMAGSLTDIHKRKQDDLALREMNRKLELANNYLDNFVYTAAHDLRAPVSNLRTLLGMMESDNKLAENLNFQRVVQSANRLENTLQGLVRILEIQRNESPEVSRLDIASVFTTVRDELSQEEELENARFETSFEASYIYYVAPFLQSILRNLLSNALKYRSPERPLLVELSTRKTGGFVLLEIKDNGIGLDLKRYGKKLFKPFERLTKQAMGQGLGLHLVKTMVERNGGYIEVEGEAGHGLCFRLHLKPYLTQEEEPHQSLNA